MKKSSTTYHLPSLLLFIVTLALFPIAGNAQCHMACNQGGVQISLSSNNCDAIVMPQDVVITTGSNACQGPFTVEVLDHNMNPIPTSPRVTIADIGKTYTARVTNTPTGNSCMGSITILDKDIPDLSCNATTIACSDDTSPEAIGFPVPPGVVVFQTILQQGTNNYTAQGFDPCGNAILSFSDNSQSNQCASINKVISRSWLATDESGNTTTCVQTINLQRVTLGQVVAPPNYDGIDQPALLCEERCGPPNPFQSCGPLQGWAVIPAGEPYAGNPAPEDELYPCGEVRCFGTGTPSGAECGEIRSTFMDTRIEVCSSGGNQESCFKVRRLWSVLDWCTGQSRTIEQTIKVEDTEGPVINGVVDVTISTDVWGCSATWSPTQPWLSDNCSSTPLDYSVSSSAGQVVMRFGNPVIENLPIGTHTVTYTAEDCCGNTSSTSIAVTVEDDVPPSAICDQHTVVNITTTNYIQEDGLGFVKVLAQTLDDGSYDNCNNKVWFKVLRMDELDSNGDGKAGESVSRGDYEAIDCSGQNGDDDVRAFPPGSVYSSGLDVSLISGSNYSKDQAYFDDFVKLCCEDVGDGPVMVVFRVFDVDPRPYEFRNVFPAGDPSYAAWYATQPNKSPIEYTGVIPEAMSGNDWPFPGSGPGPLYRHFSDCMVEIEVQDKHKSFIVAPPDIVVTCDYWFDFDADNPNDYTDELDAIFGKVEQGTSDPADRDSIVIRDRVCPAHPRFNQFYNPANPPDDRTECFDNLYDMFWGYDGYALDPCFVDLEQTIVSNLECGQGTIRRRWQSSDGESNIAEQVITIINCKDFYVPAVCHRFTPKDVGTCDRLTPSDYRIKLIEWPCDITLTRCQGPLDAFKPENLDVRDDNDRRPRFDDDNCSALAATYEDEAFVFIDSSCIKIFRTWTVIDWCRFDAGIVPNQWQWDQIIKLKNTEGPTFDNCAQTVCGYGNPNNPAAAQCTGEVTIDPGISDDCTMLDELRIDYKFDAFSDGDYDELGYSSTYGNQYPFPNPDGLPVRRFEPADYAINGFYPAGNHTILWAVEDGCGNTNFCSYQLTIEDCKPPTPYCRTGISTIPMPDVAGGYVDIWASDFDIDSGDNCTTAENLSYSFSDDISDMSRRFTVDDVTGLPEPLVVYVWDEAGNFATCEVSILLATGGNAFMPRVSGYITTEEDDPIAHVRLMVEGDSSLIVSTDGSGYYQFDSLEAGQNFIITPEKDFDPLNGVSTYDLVLMSRHILGVQTLDSPYKLISADVNQSGSISTFDLVELRKLILYITTDLPDNTSWRFIPADFVFDNPANPFSSSWPESASVNGLSTFSRFDFIGSKLGDVNFSARQDSLLGGNVPNTDDRNLRPTLHFGLQDQQLTAGQTYDIEVKASDFTNIDGFQFTLNFDPAQVAVEGMKAGQLPNMSTESFGTRLLSQGALTASWFDKQAVTLANGATLFTLRLSVQKDMLLSEAIRMSSDYTAAEAYQNNELLNVGLIFPETAIASEFQLLQNQPNPYRESTVIGFVLPEAGSATLTLHDVSGRIIRVEEGDFAKGYNEISLHTSEMMADVSGVLYYTLKTDHGTATKKMIVLNK